MKRGLTSSGTNGLTAISAMDSPLCVESLTLRTAVVHGAGKPLSDEGTEDENGGHQQNSKNRFSHERLSI